MTGERTRTNTHKYIHTLICTIWYTYTRRVVYVYNYIWLNIISGSVQRWWCIFDTNSLLISSSRSSSSSASTPHCTQNQRPPVRVQRCISMRNLVDLFKNIRWWWMKIVYVKYGLSLWYTKWKEKRRMNKKKGV